MAACYFQLCCREAVSSSQWLGKLTLLKRNIIIVPLCSAVLLDFGHTKKVQAGQIRFY